MIKNKAKIVGIFIVSGSGVGEEGVGEKRVIREKKGWRLRFIG